MTAEPNIDYEVLAQGAMRAIVRTVLTRVSKTGLPGQHHFYIAFNTGAPGVAVSKRLKQKYPREMTVVLQHRFWDLTVTDERFEVKLTFDGIPERLSVPFAAIKVFFDPSVPYGLQFEEADADSEPGSQLATARLEASSEGGAAVSQREGRGAMGDFEAAPPSRTDKKTRAPRKPRIDKGDDRAAETGKAVPKPRVVASRGSEPDAINAPKVIDLAKFRKK